MGNYNPHAPIILGQEWVPIRDVGLQYTPKVNSVELGAAFSLGAAANPNNARFYLAEHQAAWQFKQCGMVNIYPWGLQDLTGPIQQVIIPVTSGNVTGTQISFSGGSSVAECVATPGDGKNIQFFYNALAVTQQVDFFFNVSAYPVLANKRILNVSLLYSGSVFNFNNGDPVEFVNPDPGIPLTTLEQRNDAGTRQLFTPPTFSTTSTGVLSELATAINNSQSAPSVVQTIAALDIGDINNFWDPATNPSSTDERMPWRYLDLLRFESGATNRQKIWMAVQLPTFPWSSIGGSPNLWLDYFAMRVIYCEERRIAYGAKLFRYENGMNQIPLRDLTFAPNPSLPAGPYLPTLSWVSPGQIDNGESTGGQFPELNAEEQLYALTSHPGVEVDIPFPLVDHLGETFTQQPTAILPQLSLHASGSGGTLTQPHVYGRQGWAQVWGTNTATQLIYDDISGIDAPYPQVRFYARRFGDTTIPLTLTGTGVFTGYSVSIDAETFDALPEIITGVREVTLRFSTAPPMGAATGTPGWTWSAINEFAGNRWEILCASAPAISGIPGSLYTLVPSPNQLGVATYQPTQGSTVALTWMPQGIASPWVTGASLDAATDAVLMFSQDPATITGVSISQATQSVSGIGANCGGLPCCIPSGIGYNQITWPMSGATTLVRDSFARTVATGMGSPDTGPAYTLTDVGSAYSVNGSEALITPSVAGTTSYALLSVGAPDFDITAEMGIVAAIPAGNSARAILAGRYTNANNTYTGQVRQFAAGGGATQIIIAKTVAGVETVLATYNSPLNIDAGGRLWARFMGYGPLLKFKVWAGVEIDEPDFWNIETSDASLTTGNLVGIAGRIVAGTTVAFDNLLVTSPAYWFGAYELQRWDAATGGDFATIMLARDITTTTFRDFEARVGQTSVYRIRNLNAYNFAGAWSTYVSGAPPAPGVTGGCSDMTGALIFTANADQSGANNAAYFMQWDSTPNETFNLPEAGQVQFQPMYGRDGSVAFHGTERGLEQFSRTVLLQAGAIALPSLADAADIRDLAWQTLPYVCVRDGRGNRWFANVAVPNISARNDAQNYLASVQITELTLTPYPVDP